MSPKLFPTVALLGVLLTFMNACVATKDPTKPPLEEGKAPTRDAGKTEKKASLVTKLISAGEDPKSALRFTVAKGDKQYVAMTTDMERTMSLNGGVPLPQQKLPTQKLTLLLTVTDVAASGDISFDASIEKAEAVPKEGVSPRVVQYMERMVQSFAGVSASFVMSSRGVLTSYSNNMNEGLDPMVRQFLQGTEGNLPSITLPFPEAPIGVGARWSVTRPVTLQGVEMTRVAVYELTNFENGTGTVKVKVEQEAQPQDVKVEGRPGLKQRIVKMTSTSTGTHVFSLTKIVPRSGSLTSASEADMEMEFAGEKRAVHLEMRGTQKASEISAPVTTNSTESSTPDPTRSQ